ncbi:MAG TPA: alpha-2-macroglobulin family protein [Armatimonadota bacterium]|jgi:hypothetical protein
MKRLHESNAALLLMLLVLLAAAAYVINAETPRGSVSGTLVAAESGSPLPNAQVTLTPALNTHQTYYSATDKHGAFSFPGVATGLYRISAVTQAHKQNNQIIEVLEGQSISQTLELPPADPFLQVFQHQRVFTTRETPKLKVHGFAPVTELSIRVYRITDSAMARIWQSGFNDAVGGRRQIRQVNLDALKTLRLVSRTEQPIVKRDAEGVFRQDVGFGKLAAGMYLVAFDAGPAREMSVVTVTDLAIILKSSPGDTLVYAANIETGQPVPGARIQVIGKGKTVASGETGTDGTWMVSPTSVRGSQMTAVARYADSVAISGTYTDRAESRDHLRVYSYTDRPVYRPGHTVYFKSIARALNGDKYTIPAGLNARVRVTDRNEDVIYSGGLRTNKNGSMNGSFPLSRAAIPGPYTISLNAGGNRYDTDFMVAEYRKPEFEVTVTPGRKRYTASETVAATVEARYYYGAPVPDARVSWFITRSPSYYREDSGYWDSDLEPEMNDDYYSGETVKTGEGTTDSMGRLNIEFSPTPSQNADDLGQDWQYTVNATVTDASRFEAGGEGSTLVTQGDFRLQLRTEGYLAKPGVPTSVVVTAVDYDGKPVPNVSGAIEFVRHIWKRYEETSNKVATVPFVTGPRGDAAVTLTPPVDGDYGIIARAKDSRRNAVTEQAGIYVMSSDSADYGYPFQNLEVHAARRVFKMGEVAEIVVQSPKAGVSALLTIEAAHIISHKVIRLEGKSNILRIPITADMMPAVNATVSYIKGKNYFNGSALLNISRERKALRVEVTADKPIYQPGESAVYRVKTLSPEGKPVSAEVSLGLVDEAVYDILAEQTPNIVTFFYPKRLNEVRTEFSFPDIYLSGDEKAGQGIRTRRLFPDTAFWQPATVTDSQGDATFHVTLPDNLTTWRATCRAADAETRVGQTTQSVIVQKPFLLRLETPRFMVQGDEVEIAAVAHNLTTASVKATVGYDSPLAPLEGGRRIEREVGPGKTERIAWKVRPADIGGLRIRVWGTAGKLNDAMELTVPVLPKGREQTDTRCGDVQGSRTETLQVRTDCVPGTQALTIRLSPSIVSAMLGSLDYLAQYPYGCTEQTMSAFLPDVILFNLLQNRGIDEPQLKAKLPAMVQEGLLKLYTMQHDDGGWKWWTYDESDSWMTAYVVFGLIQARDSGFTINDGALSRGIDALARMAQNPDNKTGSDIRAYAAYVLTLAGRTQEAQSAIALAISTSATKGLKLSDAGRPWLALALARTGQADRANRVLSDTWKHFSDRGFLPQTSLYEWRSPAEYGAAQLYAACEITPGDPRLPALTRWIMDQRRANHWDSTRDTAAALYALARYVRLTNELTPNLNATIEVNGRKIASRRLTSADMMRPEFQVALGPRDLPVGPLRVTIRAAGTGRLYYTASLTQSATMDLGSPLSNEAGITIERRYRKVEPGENPYNERALADWRPSVKEFRSGDIIEVTLVLHAIRAFDYLMVEDPVPAGAEVRDRGAVDASDWRNWWADQIVRDQKVAFGIRHIEPGLHRLDYRFTATVPGRYTALPPRVFDMYNPSLRAESRADEITIKE